jgi:excisionase family DNA binding protein
MRVETMATEEKLLFSLREAGAALGVGLTKTYDLIAQGRLKAVKLGKQTKVTRPELNRFIAELPPCSLQQALVVADEADKAKAGAA